MKFYSYSKCGTCRKAKKFLDNWKIGYQELDITLTPPPKAVLKKAIRAKGMKKLFNTSGEQYKKLKIKDKISSMTESEALDLLASNGRLIKRPVSVDKDRITVGFDEEDFKKVWTRG